MRSISLAVLFASFLFGADPAGQAPPDAERELRARVDGFNKLLVAEKYRDAEQFVLPESRDVYYTSEKPHILDFEVNKINWADHFQTATVSMASNVMVRRAELGSFEVKTAYYGHWKLDKGEWWYFYPQVMDRITPFGMMKVNPTLAHESGMDLDQQIAKGKEQLAAARDKSIAVDRSSVALPDKTSSEKIVISNLLPGPLYLGCQRASGAGFDFTLAPNQLGPKGSAELRIFRSTKAEFKPGTVLVRANPTGQTLVIAVN